MPWAKAKAKARAKEEEKDTKEERAQKEMRKEREKGIVTVVGHQDTLRPNAPTQNPNNSRGIAMGAANGDTGGQSAEIERARVMIRNPHKYRKYKHHQCKQRHRPRKCNQ